MFYGSKGIALLLSFCISAIATAFMTLVPEISSGALFLNFFISFAVAYILSLVILEFLIFKEIHKLYSLLDKLSKKDITEFKDESSKGFNPLKRVNKEIYSYALHKQREIDELKKLEAFRKEFIANISHELKTPLFAAQGFVHTLLDGAVKDKSVRTKFLKKAAKSLDGLDRLVQDLLTLSHIETGEIKMHFENFDIVRMAEEIIEQYENKAERKDIKLKVSSDSPKRIYVYGDWQRINQVLTNLISNGIKYTEKVKGKVTVGFNIRKDSVEVFVKDTGEGIPQEDLGRIFERFYRVDKSRSREKGGTGLGLAIVKHIIEEHNSVVKVESKVGKGSTFSFVLPLGEEPEYATDEEE
ncbi:MAG: sensor histidine kinase [Candidatus Cyclobacteriaceae bacterium M2_1C_046]